MKHPERYKVTRDNGPRPAGPANQCFYCTRKIGQEHAADCPLRVRTVVVDISLRIGMQVPETWTESNIQSFFNGGNCINNQVTELENSFLAAGKKCLCEAFSGVRFVREATAEDEELYQIPEPL